MAVTNDPAGKLKSGTGVCVWCWRGQETRDSSRADDDHHSQEPAYKDSKHGWSLSPLTTVDQRSTVASGDQGDQGAELLGLGR